MPAMKKINIDIDHIDRIYHIADVHVRNVKRHDEYRAVFDRLYNYIDTTKTKNSIIYIAGDIVHSKTELSPESVDLVSDFFTRCADLLPTVIIAGNHDCNLNNSSRLDAITPIVNAIRHTNIFYLKDTGVYEIADCQFNVMSVFDKPNDYIKGADFEGKNKIALHHGAVNNALTDHGVMLSNSHVTNDLFIDHDMAMLGDIHKMQFLDKNNTIAYAGSLIQQSHGETLYHGILVWDVPSRTAEFIEIKNDYGYYTFDIVKGKITNDNDDVPCKPRLRLKVTDTDSSDLRRLVSEIKQRYDVKELSIQHINNVNQSSPASKIQFTDYREVESQNKIITDYLINNFGVLDNITDAVRHINRKIHSKLPESEVNRNITWIPKSFEFSNMFSYGPNNIIDFSNMCGTYGLFAPNASGKSTLLDALSFCCFDKCSRTSKAIHVLNNKKSSFQSKFCFELDGITYFIKRDGIKNNIGHVKVTVDFWYVDTDGNEVLLNGDQRDSTNKIIRKYLGSYEDFVLTALSLQNNNTGFIDKAQRERKELLSQFLDIDIFEQQYQIANEDIKDTAAAIREHKRIDHATLLTEANINIATIDKVLRQLNHDKQSLSAELSEINAELLSLTRQLLPVDNSLLDADIIKIQLKEIEEEQQYYIDQLSNIDVRIEQLVADAQLKKDAYDILKANGIEQRIIMIQNGITRLQDIKSKITINENTLQYKRHVADQLSTHEYDPNCQYCISNPVVKNAKLESEQIPELERELLILQQDYNSSGSLYNIESLNDLRTSYESSREQLQLVIQSIEKLRMNKSNLESAIQTNTLKRRHTIDQYEKALQQIHNVKSNQIIENKISGVELQQHVLIGEIKKIDDAINQYQPKLYIATKTKEDAEKSIARLAELEQEYIGYEFYLKAIKRDGVPYELIEKALPQLEAEINNILTQIVEFTVLLNTDGKNINAYIVYDSDNYWPLELTSGMEKFIASLAIRISLINISSLPRPNFIAIDEGLGVLDSDNLNSIYMLFDYLKSQFEFVLLITHIDSAKDFVTNLLEINKVNGYSKIDFC
jgi:DNA repair exonuclease SbcCD ATPase subunit